jgi:ceramide glucosyltransferase
MTELFWVCALFALLTALIHLASTLLVVYRVRWKDEPAPAPVAPPVSVLRPVCGLDPYDVITLRSGFELSYPSYELILCCADPGDPVIPVIRRLIAEYPRVDARLLIGDDAVTSNPKLNNLIKGWREARHDWVVMADSNVLMPHDYLERLFAGWRLDTGLLCAPPIGCVPRGFWAEVECAFLNTYQARWQYAADTVGFGFAQGKTMLWRRSLLENAGGISALGAEIAEDAAATKVVRRTGRRVRLVDRAFGQPLGHRTAAQIWSRQLRWAKLRRATFPACFLPEIATGSFLPLIATALAAQAAGLPVVGAVAAMAAFWYACEAFLAHMADWHVSALSPLAWLMRDLMLPVLWGQAWVGKTFSWRGNDMSLADAMAGN